SLANVEVRLEKRKYGKIAVKVVDPEGHPLSGATVTAHGRTFNPRQVDQAVALDMAVGTPTMLHTDKSAKVLLEKQPDGPRFVHVQYPGCYAGTDPSVTVVADDTVSVTITLKRGLTIAGSVDVPPGSQAGPLIAFVSRSSMGFTQSSVAKDGRFS